MLLDYNPENWLANKCQLFPCLPKFSTRLISIESQPKTVVAVVVVGVVVIIIVGLVVIIET